jgi:hypothetical protein
VNYFTLGIINILMGTIKDLHISAAQTPILGGVMESLCTGLSLGQRDPVSDSGPILKTGRDSDCHPPLLPGGGLPVCTGPSSEIRIGKAEREKREKDRRPNAFFRAQTRLAQQKLFTICKFCMIFVALIPVMNYNAQIAFKRR